MFIGFLGVIAKLSHICFSCLAQFPSSSSYSPLKIILKQYLLFFSGSVNIKQLLEEVEQNIVICQWRAGQLFADAVDRGK